MLKSHTKRALDAAVDELKRDGYVVLVLMLQKPKDDEPMPEMEVLCSETTNPLIVAAMAQEALTGLKGPLEEWQKLNADPEGHVN